MPLQNFQDGLPPTVDAAWLNAIDAFYVTLFQSATTAAAARTALGGTASGVSLFTAVDEAAARTAIDAMQNPVTTAGDLIYGTGADAVARLGVGSTAQVLGVSGGLPAWVSNAGRLISTTVYGIGTNSAISFGAGTSNVTITPASSGICRIEEGMPVVCTGGSLPAEITAGTTYYITDISSLGSAAVGCRLTATKGGAYITYAAGGTGTANNPVYNKATNNPSYIEIELVGGGAGGGGVTAVAGAAASGGGSGCYIKATIPNAAIITGDVTLTVGMGGAGGTSAGTAGAVGAATSAAILTGPFTLTAAGCLNPGLGSTAASTSRLGGLGATYAPLNTTSVGINIAMISADGNPGGSSSSTAAAATTVSGHGAAGPWGGGGQGGAGATTTGKNAFGFGAGGGGAMGATANAGGNGMGGCIILREYSA